MKKGLFFGILIILVGVIFLLNALGTIHFQFDTWWPIILIVIGLPGLIVGPGRFFSLILVYLGGWFLCKNNGWLPANLEGIFWPVLIILIGVAIVSAVFRRKRPKEDKSSRMDYSGTFGDMDVKNTSEAFRDGKASAVFGTVKVDLTGAKPESAEISLKLEAVFGSLDIVVPAGWDVRINGSLVLGTIQNNTAPGTDGNRTILNASCSGFMGMITLRN